MNSALPEGQDLKLENELWEFSLIIWKHQHVRETLLAWQEQFGLRVNMMLYGVWCASKGYGLSTDHLAIENETASWHQNHVLLLRDQRQALPKSGAGAFVREKVLEAEILAEQIEISLIFRSHVDLSREDLAVDEASIKDVLISNMRFILGDERFLSLDDKVEFFTGVCEAMPKRFGNISPGDFREELEAIDKA